MSNIGKIPIKIPEGVNVEIADSYIKTKGPKGELQRILPEGISIAKEDSVLKLVKKDKSSSTSNLYGLSRTLVANMIQGVTEGFEKKLKMVGVGFKAQTSDNKLVLNVGFSHPVEIEIPEKVEVKVEKNVQISISGIDKELVGKTAASIRAIKKPEPYKGKGIMYENEKIRRKAGKALKAGTTG